MNTHSNIHYYNNMIDNTNKTMLTNPLTSCNKNTGYTKNHPPSTMCVGANKQPDLQRLEGEIRLVGRRS